ncbi:hypothetical protein [Alkalibacterium sp. 20]|uniref:hypothetical protein n=1 Tax=Alkalibacterium sp. 20 TaxID=1798803 RepID=UPI0011606590|nr:hypothetical protein [Alkalibacterium sp. 20]
MDLPKSCGVVFVNALLRLQEYLYLLKRTVQKDDLYDEKHQLSGHSGSDQFDQVPGWTFERVFNNVSERNKLDKKISDDLKEPLFQYSSLIYFV